jgi:hypothetical protein
VGAGTKRVEYADAVDAGKVKIKMVGEPARLDTRLRIDSSHTQALRLRGDKKRRRKVVWGETSEESCRHASHHQFSNRSRRRRFFVHSSSLVAIESRWEGNKKQDYYLNQRRSGVTAAA